ncbi:uncharacterized protein [Elaeis guineensis]|uniref:Uncharacterized protein LOC114912731 isoform X2 n=1 Tax=Elaeis guineensis var. tenera TaxID=51953 RepID=A0A8N4EST3_ELAGV|nr:uncharacterized protein LOC114912731 isoform X2 [Elaeis guineensis]
MQETALYSLIVLSADDASKNSLQASGVVECSSKYVGDLLFQPKRCIVSKSAFELLKLVHEALKYQRGCRHRLLVAVKFNASIFVINSINYKVMQ